MVERPDGYTGARAFTQMQQTSVTPQILVARVYRVLYDFSTNVIGLNSLLQCFAVLKGYVASSTHPSELCK